MRLRGVAALAVLLLAAGCSSGGDEPAADAEPSTVAPSPSSVAENVAPEDDMFSDTAMYVLALRSDPESGPLAEQYSDDELATFGHLACAELAAGSDRRAMSAALMSAGVEDVVLSASLPFAAVAVLCPDMMDEMEAARLD